MTVRSVTTRITPDPQVAVFSPAGTVIARDGATITVSPTGVPGPPQVPTELPATAKPAAAALPGLGPFPGGALAVPQAVPLAPPGVPALAAAVPFGMLAAAAGVPGAAGLQNPATATFTAPINQLAALNPLAALAALDPSAAVTALSPSLQFLNPAINPAAALLAFNPQAAPALAITNPAAVNPFLAGFGLPFAV